MMYLWFKAFHVIAVVAWMAGLFYLPRLFVYHEMSAVGSETSELFKVMERRLLKAIMTPAAVVSWVFGLLTAWQAGYLVTLPVWFVLKVALVLALSAFHLKAAGFVRAFTADERGRGDRYYRVFNEIPTVLLIGIVILVVVQPFG